MDFVALAPARGRGSAARIFAVHGGERRIPLGRFALAALLAFAVLMSAACGGDSESAATDTAASQTAASPAAGDSETQTLSANDASEDELAAAFEAAGISNAAKWAHEVVEYRPYPADDTEFQKLRAELAKYNPGPGVVDAIVGQLHLP